MFFVFAPLVLACPFVCWYEKSWRVLYFSSLGVQRTGKRASQQRSWYRCNWHVELFYWLDWERFEIRIWDPPPANICFTGIPQSWIGKVCALVFVAWVLPALLGSVYRRFPFFLSPVREILETCSEDLVFCSCVLQIWTMLSVWKRIWYLIPLLYSLCKIRLQYFEQTCLSSLYCFIASLEPSAKASQSSFNSNGWALVWRPGLRVSRFGNKICLLNGCALLGKNE